MENRDDRRTRAFGSVHVGIVIGIQASEGSVIRGVAFFLAVLFSYVGLVFGLAVAYGISRLGDVLSERMKMNGSEG